MTITSSTIVQNPIIIALVAMILACLTLAVLIQVGKALTIIIKKLGEKYFSPNKPINYFIYLDDETLNSNPWD
jgi:phosphotransferase system  glucose/maltose/N-acetylglucosamine-specific IIC component